MATKSHDIQIAGRQPGTDIFGRGKVPQVPLAGGDRRQKIAESNTPFPRDRVPFSYHHFHNTVIDNPESTSPWLYDSGHGRLRPRGLFDQEKERNLRLFSYQLEMISDNNSLG